MITLTVHLIRFLFTHIVGVTILAGVGLLCVCGGILSFFASPETQATTIAMTELEARSELPGQQWLRLTDGCLVWPEATALVLTREKRGSGEVAGKKTQTIYVPLISKTVLDAWRRQGLDTPFPRNKVRAFVKMGPGELDKDFPQDAVDLVKRPVSAARLKVQPQVSGLAGSLQGEDKVVREGLTREASGMDPRAVLVLRYAAQPPTKGATVAGGIVAVLFGLVFAVPLVLRLARGQCQAGGSGAGLHGAAVAGFEAGLRDAVGAGIAKGVAARSGGAPPVARVVQFYYLLNGQRFGPVLLSQLRDLWTTGNLRPDSLVWQEGTPDWVQARSVRELLK
jgi:hypothetical protein